MELKKVIMGRRSIRNFKDKNVGKSVILEVIDAARWAPSNCDIQGWRFIIIQNEKIKQKIVDEGGAVFIKDAPVVILVIYDNRTDNVEYKDYIQSAAACIQNMNLTAYSLGLGTCWVCQLPTKKRLRNVLNIPSHYDPIACVVMGYPKIFPKPLARRDKIEELTSINSFKFEEKVQKRSIKLKIKIIARNIYFRMPTIFKKVIRPFVERWFVKKFGMSWTLEDVGKHWDETEDYDDINKRTYSYSRRFTDGYRLLDMKHTKDNAHILDICCRTGNGSLFFGKNNKNLRFVCMDVSDKMLKIADDALSESKIRHETRLFTTNNLPVKDNEFDYILCFETLEHMPNPKKFIDELYRSLKKGGDMVLTTPNDKWEFIHWFAAITHIHHDEGPHKFLKRKEIIKLIEKSGFKIMKEETTVSIPYGPKFLIKIGELLEKKFKNSLMPAIGLRRIYICRKM